MAAAQRQERKNEMQVDKNHNETATACVAEFFSKMTQGQIDPGALTTALFNKAIIEMMRMDGADAVHNALRVYADQFDDRKPNDGTNEWCDHRAAAIVSPSNNSDRGNEKDSISHSQRSG